MSSRLQEGAMTSVSMVEVHSPTGNPIDLVEEIVVANDWAHDRASEEEMVVEISGRWCDYRLYFLWQEELSALHFSCGFDMKVPKRRRGPFYERLRSPMSGCGSGISIWLPATPRRRFVMRCCCAASEPPAR